MFPSYSLPLFFIGAEFEASPSADGPTAATRGCCFPHFFPTQGCGLRNPPAMRSRGEGKLCPGVEIRGCEARPLGSSTLLSGGSSARGRTERGLTDIPAYIPRHGGGTSFLKLFYYSHFFFLQGFRAFHTCIIITIITAMIILIILKRKGPYKSFPRRGEEGGSTELAQPLAAIMSPLFLESF